MNNDPSIQHKKHKANRNYIMLFMDRIYLYSDDVEYFDFFFFFCVVFGVCMRNCRPNWIWRTEDKGELWCSRYKFAYESVNVTFSRRIFDLMVKITTIFSVYQLIIFMLEAFTLTIRTTSGPYSYNAFDVGLTNQWMNEWTEPTNEPTIEANEHATQPNPTAKKSTHTYTQASHWKKINRDCTHVVDRVHAQKMYVACVVVLPKCSA